MLLATLGAVMSGCGTTARGAPEQELGPGWAEKAIHWGVSSIADEDKVVLHGFLDYCEGDKKPFVHGFGVRYAGRRVFIAMNIAVPKKHTHRGSLCFGSQLPLHGRVTLDRPIRGSTLLDASTHPPTIRWPLAKR
jgi:hypothetical protein